MIINKILEKKFQKKKKFKYTNIFIILLIIGIMIILIFLKVKSEFFKKQKLFKVKIIKEFPKLNQTEVEHYYLSCLSPKYRRSIRSEKKKLNKYFSLKILPEDHNDPLYIELKTKLLNHISKYQKQNYTEIKTFLLKEILNMVIQ